jgi:hypothetical protein
MCPAGAYDCEAARSSEVGSLATWSILREVESGFPSENATMQKYWSGTGFRSK